MLARDPFNGKPAPPPPPGGERERELTPYEKEMLRFVRLTGIFQRPDRDRWYATFYDQASGPPEVLVNTLTIPDLIVNTPSGSRLFEAKCVYINAMQVVLQDKAGKYYLMHIGDYILPSLDRPLKDDALKEFGLTPKKVASAQE
jgi:hypothetical protein